MSRSPSPDHLSLSAGSWKSETSPVKAVKSVVQRPNVEEPIATSSPKCQDTSPRRSRKRAASPEGRQDTSSHRSNKRSTLSEARRNSSCHENRSAKGKKRECPFCHQFPGHVLRRHVMQNHLPAIADPSKVCWNCHRSFLQTSQVQSHIQSQCLGGHYLNNIAKWRPLVMTMFRLIGRDLGLQPSQLIHYAGQHREFCPEEFTPSPEDVNLMQAFDRNCGHNIQASYRFAPPNALICLIHWRILGHLLGRVSQAVRREIFDLTSPSAISTATPPVRAPTATVSMPPSTPQVVPTAPPTQPVMGSFAPPVVPRAPQFHQPIRPVVPMAPQPNQQSVCSAVPMALQSHQPQPVQQVSALWCLWPHSLFSKMSAQWCLWPHSLFSSNHPFVQWCQWPHNHKRVNRPCLRLCQPPQRRPNHRNVSLAWMCIFIWIVSYRRCGSSEIAIYLSNCCEHLQESRFRSLAACHPIAFRSYGRMLISCLLCHRRLSSSPSVGTLPGLPTFSILRPGSRTGKCLRTFSTQRIASCWEKWDWIMSGNKIQSGVNNKPLC